MNDLEDQYTRYCDAMLKGIYAWETKLIQLS